jgi:hypothetical protein
MLLSIPNIELWLYGSNFVFWGRSTLFSSCRNTAKGGEWEILLSLSVIIKDFMLLKYRYQLFKN